MFNKMIAGILPYMPKKLVWIFSKRYIAGENIEDALRESRKLNAEQTMVTVDILGEYIKELSEATENKKQYIELIKRFTDEKIDGNFSVKPSMFGLLLDKESCYQNIREIVAAADECDSFIRVDMEDSTCTDAEVEIFRRLKAEFPTRVGLVVQSYMRRTLSDVRDLMDMHSEEAPLNFRLCKGIYVEPVEVAYKKYQEVRDHYLEDLEYMLQNGIYVGIATHDKYLVDKAFELLEKYNTPKDKYEFQMLYGVTPDLRSRIMSAGHRMRVYVPYGVEWFGYSTRRLKENPNMAWLIIKALFVRG
ncbi:proline dehydrogenase [Prolixibacter denitrificans]|uniref:proline dehydrogenase n=2 Tax=Prolixibacteraceae TaxID=1471398 RepID=A0A2P8CKD5_9BACT|nr:proline dehydrogenase [Prolixibacter denitrificans]GET20013.1 proline dehydrogenase [Prolixibacter denitrificans]GET26691.1 proline dehydrogenase [Prolixibacter sp. NT017]